MITALALTGAAFGAPMASAAPADSTVMLASVSTPLLTDNRNDRHDNDRDRDRRNNHHKQRFFNHHDRHWDNHNKRWGWHDWCEWRNR
jgi:hypothetical protein